MSVSAGLRQRLLFLFLCTVWGATWLAMKTGAASVPPALFSGTRWTVAGLVLLAVRRAQGHAMGIPRRMWPRLAAVALLMVATNAVLNLYSLRLVGSGLAAIIGSSLTPISLLGFGLALGQERVGRARLAAIGLGLAGILLLFGPKALAGRLDATEALGAAGIALSTLCYTAGSVLARPLMRTLSPAEVAAATNLVGGLALLLGSLAFEPGAGAALRGDWGVAAWAAWLYLLLLGSLGATIVYFYLVREWGAGTTGSYAFVSPVIAVGLGVAVAGEHVDGVELAGMALMLAAVVLVLRRPRTPTPLPAPPPPGLEPIPAPPAPSLALPPASAMRSGDPGGVT